MTRTILVGTPTPEQIKQSREARGLSQGDMARLMELHPNTITRWERGGNDMRPSLWALWLLMTNQHPHLALADKAVMARLRDFATITRPGASPENKQGETQ